MSTLISSHHAFGAPIIDAIIPSEHKSMVRVSLIQTESNGTKSENEQKVLGQLSEAVKDSPDIICLSELFLSWGKDYYGGAVRLDEIAKYQDFARENHVNIILGSVALESDVPGKTTNTSFVINREGNIIGRYDKKYLYKVNRPDFQLDENDDTIPGQTIGLFEIEGIKIGVGICFDLRFPEYFRELAKGGAEIIFLPAHFNKSTGAVAWDVLPRARAIENQVYFCAVNQTGEKLCADTKIIKYDGENLRALGNEEGMLTADLDLEAQKRYREEMPILEL